MAAGNFNTLRGFRDLLREDCVQLTALEEASREAFELYGYREIRIPTLELEQLFVKSTGETSDIVEKEMFKLTDAGGRELALRPEGTPGAVRAYLNAHLGSLGPIAKLYYIGSMFRAERPQAGRFREFGQIGIESIGNGHPAADVETILCLRHIFDHIGLKGKTRLSLNNIGCDVYEKCRPRYRETLITLLKDREESLCDSCKRRINRNPLRTLDCKKDGPTLVKDAPKFSPCDKCRKHVETVSAMLHTNSCPHTYPDPGLVRGLDYYTSTVFEFKGDGLGSQDAIAGGGRYDALVKGMGGPDTPAVGWAMGLDRALMAVRAADPAAQALTNILPPPATDVFVAVATTDSETVSEGIRVLESFREFGIRTAGGLFLSSLKAQLREADRQKAAYTVILGADELKKDPPACVLKDMETGRQSETAMAHLLEVVGDSLVPLNTLSPQTADAG